MECVSPMQLAVMRWHRRFFDIIMLWEGVVRAVFVQLPTKLFELIDGFDKVISFFFVYVMLQALAILWGFLFNVGAILGDNMINILQMPFSQALCVLLTHASVIGIVLSFGRATWILTWQSTQNFPLIRRIIAYECRPQSVINIVAMPMLVLLPSLILVPSMCTQRLHDDYGASWAKTICEESYVKFLTDKHPVFQRALRLSTAIAIWQFIQACLEILPLLSGFSTLSVLQSHAKWFPDATSVEYQGDTSVEIHHTAIVKLNLGLADDTRPAMHLDQPRYASCGTQWHGLGLVDFALLAEAAYFNPLSNDTAKFVSSVVATNLGDIHVRLPQLNTKTGSKLDFYEAFIPSLNTSIIAVRGTDIWRFTDFVEDAKMFVEPVIFSILSAIFPSIRIWPDVTFSTLIELYSELISLFGLQHDFWYYHELLEYVESIQDREVVLTGHSMGGGIAKLVGSILGKTSITFSPPGFVQSYSKLVHDIGGKSMKVDRSNLHHRSVAVVPEYDPVTLVDAQAGMIQKISKILSQTLFLLLALLAKSFFVSLLHPKSELFCMLQSI
ncbi:hypothetical protein P43SY_000007 [Pythium insidiosum]|uniref:Fungal lipase-type domain-containing protein n=1 Tax=Pythium insidiosum TaxID=114742 RepID=A0AAD5Q5D5_PYTIN|nr:hypothetical protein P43SY_000007 [Pythium insidiosum]